MFKFLTVEKSDSGITIIGTNETVDRDGDIVRVAGVDTENYEKNPVILFAHNWHDYPVAKAKRIEKAGDKLLFEPEFAETEEGEKLKYLVENGYIKMTSIGFRPKKVFHKDEFETEIKALDADWFAKNQDKLVSANRVIWESELYELSFVPIPANPTAEIVLHGKGIKTCAFKMPTMTAENSMDDILIELAQSDVKRAVAVHSTPVVLDKAWSKDEALKSVKEWATGNDGEIDFTKFKQAFAWYDAENADNLTAYKLPHHIVEDGELKAVWRGVVAAMAALLGGRGGVDIPEDDRKSVYDHLAAHYQDVDKEPPEFRSYEPAEILATWDDEHKTAWLSSLSTDELSKIFVSTVKELTEKLDEATATIAKLTSEIDTVKSIGAPSGKTDVDTRTEDKPDDEKSDETKEDDFVIEIELPEGVKNAELSALLAHLKSK